MPLGIPLLMLWRGLLTLAAATAGGYAAMLARVPLPWVLGAMLGTAVVILPGLGARQALPLRRLAQVAIGTALGLSFTEEVMRQLLSLGHWILLACTFSIGMSAVFSRAIQRMAKMDGPTAIYAVATGASSEMALQAQQAGANGAQVAAAHAVRIILVVSLASVVAQFSGANAGPTYFSAGTPILSWPLGVLFLLLAPLCGWLANRVRFPNGWLLGPVILAAAFATTGTVGRVHPTVLVLAQILIGWGLGQHMTREFFIKSPRMLAAAALVTVAMLALCVLVAWVASHASATSLLTTFLSLAPGGTAEMALIAKNYGIGAPIVTAFHVFRVIATVLLIRHLAAALLRCGWLSARAPGTA
jgi:hypothetical protein